MTPVVVDASAVLQLLALEKAPVDLPDLHAPALLWSETLAAIRTVAWRGDLPADAERRMLDRLWRLPVVPFDDRQMLLTRARGIAANLGWAKTYDAEYVALAEILAIPLLSLDARLARGAGHLVEIVTPVDIGL